MLWVWFNCSPIVPSESDVEVANPVEIYTKEKQRTVVRFFCDLKEWKG